MHVTLHNHSGIYLYLLEYNVLDQTIYYVIVEVKGLIHAHLRPVRDDLKIYLTFFKLSNLVWEGGGTNFQRLV